MSTIKDSALFLVERNNSSYKIEYKDLQLNNGGGIYVNVKDFGALGDGVGYRAPGSSVGDDSIPIQAAIDSMSNGGGTLYFPAGEYRLSSPLVINRVNDTGAPPSNRNRINVKGDGKGNTVLKFQGATQGAGRVCLHYIGVPTAPDSGAAHIYSTISDIAFASTNRLAAG